MATITNKLYYIIKYFKKIISPPFASKLWAPRDPMHCGWSPTSGRKSRKQPENLGPPFSCGNRLGWKSNVEMQSMCWEHYQRPRILMKYFIFELAFVYFVNLFVSSVHAVCWFWGRWSYLLAHLV